MEAILADYPIEKTAGITSRGRILVVDDDARGLEARSSSLRQEGFEVRAFRSCPEGLSCLESEQFDLVIVKLGTIPSLEDEEFWSVESRSTTKGPSWFWRAVSMSSVTWMWRTLESWTN